MEHLRFDASHGVLFAATSSGVFSTWDPRSGRRISNWANPDGTRVNGIDIGPAGRVGWVDDDSVYYGERPDRLDQCVRVNDEYFPSTITMLPSGSAITTVDDLLVALSVTGETRWQAEVRILQVVYCPRHRELFTIVEGDERNEVRVFDEFTGRSKTLKIEGSVASIAVSSDGARIASCNEKGQLQILDRRGRLVSRLQRSETSRTQHQLLFAESDRMLILSGESQLEFFDCSGNTLVERGSISCRERSIHSMQLSEEHAVLFLGCRVMRREGDSGIQVLRWEADDGRRLSHQHQDLDR
ncbi:MAG: WD40 repeat domain-containing protein [Planctomycetota bacterium]